MPIVKRVIFALSSVHLTRITRPAAAGGEGEEQREFRRCRNGRGVSPPATREAATAARRANDERDPRPPTAGARGAVDGRGVKRAKGWGRGNRAPARQIVYVGLVAEGSARGKERHETERFLGLAGTFFHLGVSAALLSFSLSLSLYLVLVFRSLIRDSPHIHLRPLLLVTALVSPCSLSLSLAFPFSLPPFFKSRTPPPLRGTRDTVTARTKNVRAYVPPSRYAHIDLRSSVFLSTASRREAAFAGIVSLSSRDSLPDFFPFSFSLSLASSLRPITAESFSR